MKKYIAKIVLFFAIMALIDVCFGMFGSHLQSHAKGGETRAFDDLIKKDKHDILILGSSRAHHHYDTPLLSDTLRMDVYNAGHDGNGVILAFGILKMVLGRYHPKLVVFDVEPAFDIYIYNQDNHDTRYLKYLKPYYLEQGIEEIFRDVSVDEWYKVQSGMIRYNTDIISKMQDNVRGQVSMTRGFAPLYGDISVDLKVSDNEGDIQLDSLKLKYIERLIYLAHRNNVPIIFVASPKYGAINSKVLEPVKDICRKTCVPFLDYYADKEFMSHPYWFKEPMHLNEKGANIFSQKICNDIKVFVRRDD